MALVRKYFTYVEDIVYNQDFPGGKYEGPEDYIKIHFGPSLTFTKDPMFGSHYQDQDSRKIACLDGDNTSMVTEGGMTVMDHALTYGLLRWNAKELTDIEALVLADLFSPTRQLSRSALATGTLVGSSVAIGDIATVGTQAFTAVASGATGFQFDIGIDDNTTMANLSASIDIALSSVSSSVLGNTITISSTSLGAPGNLIALASSQASIVASGPTLTGGIITDIVELASWDASTPPKIVQTITLG